MKNLALLFAFSLAFAHLSAQDDLLSMLEGMESEPEKELVYATFKSTRIVNGHSIETPAGGVMQMIISHRFGPVNQGIYDLFGLDQANMRMGLEYGITDWLCIGAGRSNIQKTYDGFVKAKFLREGRGKGTSPITLAYLGGMTVATIEWADPNRVNYFSSRLNYYHQLLIARKVTDRLSLQLMPSMVHRNLVATVAEENDVFAIGGGGRYKVTGSVAINAEYYHLLPGYTADNSFNNFSIGVDLETGGHVFQLMFSNSVGMTENFFIPNSGGPWWDSQANRIGDVRFGFAINRVFTVSHKGKKDKSEAKAEG
jgi:hypothetical protein